jgi:hypothetical protein
MNSSMADHRKALVTNHDSYWSVPEPEKGFENDFIKK